MAWNSQKLFARIPVQIYRGVSQVSQPELLEKIHVNEISAQELPGQEYPARNICAEISVLEISVPEFSCKGGCCVKSACGMFRMYVILLRGIG